MLRLSRFLRALSSTCAIVTAGAAITSGHAAFAKGPTFGVASLPHSRLQKAFRPTAFSFEKALARVGVSTSSPMAPSMAQKGVASILRSIPSSPQILCAPGDPVTVGFAVSDTQVLQPVEGGTAGTGNTTVNLRVNRTGELSGTTTVRYITEEAVGVGLAKGGEDFVAVTDGQLVFAPGERSKTVPITIINDSIYEDPGSYDGELFRVRITAATDSSGTAVTLGTSLINYIEIIDDDSAISLSPASPTVKENAGTVSLTAVRTGSSLRPATVTYSTSNGSATAPGDYTATTNTVTIPAGQTSATFTIPITNDSVDEDDETFRVTLSNPSLNSSLGQPATVNVTITDDDVLSLVISDESGSSTPYAIEEGDSGATNQVFTVTLRNPAGAITASTRQISVNYATSDGSATAANNDYTSTSGTKTLVFAPGQTVKTITIPIIGDTTFEDDEAYVLTLSAPQNALLPLKKVTGVILNDDPRPVSTLNFTSTDVSTSEDNPSVTLTVSRTGDTTTAASVKVTTADGTATSGTDYSSTTTTLQFPANAKNTAQSLTVTIPILDDAIDEPTETFTATLSAPTPAGSISSDRSISQLGTDKVATVSIADNDATPTLSIDNESVAEGDNGTTELVFTATLDTESGQTISVDYATADGTATVADNDYVAQSGTLTFAPGETSKTITVVANGDTTPENNETFALNLSSAVNVKLATTKATGTITNDDTPLVLSNFAFSSSSLKPTVNETAGVVVLTVTRTQGSDRAATIKYATSNGTAKAGSDYTAASGILTFAINQKSANITVPVLDDTLKEDAETFNVTLSSPSSNATLPAEKTAVVTIKDNEGTPSLSIANISANEGNSGKTTLNFTVSLQPQSQNKVTVVAATVTGGTASSTSGKGQDYETKTASLTFNPGESTKTFSVTIISDTLVEPDETVVVALSAASGAPVKQAKAIGTILNDDQPGGGGTISFLTSSYSIDEGAGFATITIARSGNVDMINQQSASVRVTSGQGTATVNKDYKPINTVITFAPGETVKSFNITIINDTLFEQEESIPLTLSAPSDNAILGSTTAATLFISDDDAQPSSPANSAKGS